MHAQDSSEICNASQQDLAAKQDPERLSSAQLEQLHPHLIFSAPRATIGSLDCHRKDETGAFSAAHKCLGVVRRGIFSNRKHNALRRRWESVAVQTVHHYR
jgi:hypothetical protein